MNRGTIIPHDQLGVLGCKHVETYFEATFASKVVSFGSITAIATGSSASEIWSRAIFQGSPVSTRLEISSNSKQKHLIFINFPSRTLLNLQGGAPLSYKLIN